MQPVSQAIADYPIYLRIEQGASKATAKTYGPHLRHFLRWSEHQAKAAGLTPTRCGRFARPCGRGPCGLTRGGCPPGYM